MTQGSLSTAIADALTDLRRFAMTLTRDPVARDDLVQDTIVKALEHEDQLRDPGGARQWMFRIMSRRQIDRQRSDRARQAREDGLQWLGPDHQPAAQEVQLRLSQLRQAFEALPPDQKRALQLVAIDGLSCRDAAEVEGIALGTLLSRVARARQRLRAFEEGTALPDMSRKGASR